MLTQYRLTLKPDRPCRPRAEWGYCLYAGLLREAPAELGAAVHEDRITPVSQYLSADGKTVTWTVNLLGEDSEEQLGGCLAQAEEFRLQKEGVCLRVTGRRVRRVESAEELLTLAAGCQGVHRLQFLTPAAFKSRGKYVALPTPRLITQNLLNKWNGCITECPIEDEDGEGMEAIASGLECRRFQIYSRDYHLKGKTIPGFCGELVLENHLTGFHRQLADALLIFSQYAGVGIKTTLGMGGVLRR